MRHRESLAIEGVQLGCAQAVNPDRADLMAVALSPRATVAGVFTRNQYPAAPVQLCRERLQSNNDIRGILVNAGVANAGMGRQGIADANQMCAAYAKLLGCHTRQILPVSTGVIMQRLHAKQYMKGIKTCVQNLAADNWHAAADAIKTSDKTTKLAHEVVVCDGKAFHVVGIAKGTAMVHPNMATMLAFVATDAALPKQRLRAWQRNITNHTFNAVSIDGETSTNDSFISIATGAKGVCADDNALQQAMFRVCERLAEAMVKDGVGACKLLKVVVAGGASYNRCLHMARAIALSPLVKLAVAAGAADIGRLLMAIGNSGNGGSAADKNLLAHALVKIGSAPVIKGSRIHPRYNSKQAAAEMKNDEIVLSIKLGNAPHAATFKTCGLTADYITRFGVNYMKGK